MAVGVCPSLGYKTRLDGCIRRPEGWGCLHADPVHGSTTTGALLAFDLAVKHVSDCFKATMSTGEPVGPGGADEVEDGGGTLVEDDTAASAVGHFWLPPLVQSYTWTYQCRKL